MSTIKMGIKLILGIKYTRILSETYCYYLVTGTLYIIKTWLHSEHIRTFLVFRVTKHLQRLPQPLLSKTGWRQKTDDH